MTPSLKTKNKNTAYVQRFTPLTPPTGNTTYVINTEDEDYSDGKMGGNKSKTKQKQIKAIL